MRLIYTRRGKSSRRWCHDEVARPSCMHNVCAAARRWVPDSRCGSRAQRTEEGWDLGRSFTTQRLRVRTFLSAPGHFKVTILGEWYLRVWGFFAMCLWFFSKVHIEFFCCFFLRKSSNFSSSMAYLIILHRHRRTLTYIYTYIIYWRYRLESLLQTFCAATSLCFLHQRWTR